MKSVYFWDMQLSVIILNYNVRYFLELCVLSVQKAIQNIDAEIIVVDNNSSDDSCAMMAARFPNVKLIENKTNFETFFTEAPAMNPNVSKITGVICGYRVEEIEDKIMQQVRYLDKLIDELAKGKAMEKILRKWTYINHIADLSTHQL